MDTRRTMTAPAIFATLLWMMVGPITLFLLALAIAVQRGGWFTFLSLIYFPVLGGTMLGRWLEFRCGFPMTAEGEPATTEHLRHRDQAQGMDLHLAEGEPATTEHLRRYLLAAATLGLAVWIVANLSGITG
jgi:hypothetical protein